MTFRKTETENKPEYLLRLALFAFFAILLVYRLCIAFSFKHELVNGESNNIWNAMNVAHGKPIYTNPEALPLEVFQYTPLSQIPIISYAYLLDDTSPYYLYWITVLGRLTALAANCITAWLIYRLLKEVFQIPSNLAFAGGIMVLASFTHAAFAVRPDALTLLVTTWISIGFFRAIHSDKQRNLIAFSFLTAFAVLFKQDAFFLLVPIGIFLLSEKKWNQVVYISVSFLLGLFVFLGFGQFLFGPYFLYSISKGIQNPGTFAQSMIVFDKVFSLFGFHLCIALSILLHSLLTEKIHNVKKLLHYFVIFLLMLGFWSSFKSGSWINYYTPAILWSSALIIIYFVKLNNEKVLIPLIIIVCSVFICRQAYFYTLPYVGPFKTKETYIEKQQVASEIERKLKLQPKTKVLVVDPMVRNFLFKNSIMVNMEFYGVSTFNYDAIRKDQKQAIRFLVYENNEVGIIDMLDDKFRFEKQKFKLINKIGTIGIYGRK
jgi:hypothetical protein